MAAASAAVTSEANATDGPKASGSMPASTIRVSCQPMSTAMPRWKAAARSAPMPANAIWPSDS
jgi:hypothetical protein